MESAVFARHFGNVVDIGGEKFLKLAVFEDVVDDWVHALQFP